MIPLDNIMARWFPAAWNLSERKERERFQAVLRDIPDSLGPANLYDQVNKRPQPFLQEAGLKAYKFITTIDKKRKLVGFFETWAALQIRLNTPTSWNGDMLDWSRHSPPANLSKSRRPSSNGTKDRPANKFGSVASGANTTPISARRNTTKQNGHHNPTTTNAKHQVAKLQQSVGRIKDQDHKQVLVEVIGLLGKLVK